MNTLVLGLGKMLPRLLGEDVEMSLVPQSAGMVRADATQLEQVLLNLAVNARDAMPTGGKLIIETNDVHLDSDYPGHEGTGIPAGDYVMLAVSDTGLGMDRETQSHIFEPFFTTKGDRGTGLGLATVYGIVKQSGGFVWVYSELDNGTTFKVYLPRVEEPEDRIMRGVPMGSDPRGTETILVAEDEAALRTVINIYLESLGYVVLTAGNGAEAITILQNNSSIDLLVTDVIMPVIGGPQLAKIAQETRPGLPVIYISGYTDRALDRSTIGESAAFLQKPFGLRSLAVKIREMLGNE
jgi:CheY-like chemotaxis protein